MMVSILSGKLNEIFYIVDKLYFIIQQITRFSPSYMALSVQTLTVLWYGSKYKSDNDNTECDLNFTAMGIVASQKNITIPLANPSECYFVCIVILFIKIKSSFIYFDFI